MQPLPHNAMVLLERSTNEHGPLEAWQEEYLEERKLEALGLQHDEYVPVLHLEHKREDELAWMDDMLKMVDDPMSLSGKRFTGRRFVGEPLDMNREDHRAAVANDIDGMDSHRDE